MNKLALTFSYLITLLTATAGNQMPLSTSYWKSTSFLKEFNGSYRINANIEPLLSSEERAQLVAIQTLMASGDRKTVITKLKANPQLKHSPALQFNLANVLSENGDLKDAIQYYQKALTTFPAFRRAHQNLAYAYVKSNQLEDAFPHLIETIKLGGNDGSVHGLLAHCFQQKEQYEPALLSFRRALIAQPDTRDWQIGIAHSLHQLGRSSEALAQYLELLKDKGAENSAIELQLSQLYMEMGQAGKAITRLELLRRKGKLDTEYEFLLGTLLLNEGNIAVGSQTLKRCITRDGFHQSEAALKAIRHSIDLELIPLATELHQMLKPDLIKGTALLSSYHRIKAQLILIEKPNAHEGITILKELIKENPTDSYSLLLLGQQLALNDQLHEALIIFDQSVNADSAHSLQAKLAKSQTFVQLEDYSQAIKELKAYLKINPSANIQEYLTAVEAIRKARSN
ncbi:MAG: tetratricopeptide repeat protein [Akkermansiaceae bacterium]